MAKCVNPFKASNLIDVIGHIEELETDVRTYRGAKGNHRTTIICVFLFSVCFLVTFRLAM